MVIEHFKEVLLNSGINCQLKYVKQAKSTLSRKNVKLIYSKNTMIRYKSFLSQRLWTLWYSVKWALYKIIHYITIDYIVQSFNLLETAILPFKFSSFLFYSWIPRECKRIYSIGYQRSLHDHQGLFFQIYCKL